MFQHTQNVRQLPNTMGNVPIQAAVSPTKKSTIRSGLLLKGHMRTLCHFVKTNIA